MKITDQKLANFQEMIRHFAERNDIHWAMITDERKSSTEVKIGDIYRWEKYTVIWEEVPSLSEAAAPIFADAICRFKLKESANTSFEIKDVIFNDPATIILWKDGTKTVVKCQPDDIYSEEMGLALCIAKKALGNKGNFNNVFRKWLPVEKSFNTIVIADENTIVDDVSFVNKLGRILRGEF